MRSRMENVWNNISSVGKQLNSDLLLLRARLLTQRPRLVGWETAIALKGGQVWGKPAVAE